MPLASSFLAPAARSIGICVHHVCQTHSNARLQKSAYVPGSMLAARRRCGSTEGTAYFVNIRYMFNGDRLTFIRGYKLKGASAQAELPLEETLALAAPDAA